MSRAKIGLLSAALLAYALLSHYSNSVSAPRGLGVALTFGPVVLIGLIVTWRWTRPWIALLCAAATGVLIFRWWDFLEMHYEAADLIQQCGAYSLVSLSFAHSMFRVPVCTRLAQEMHGVLTPREATYTRIATLAWAAFYLLLAAAVVTLYFVASQRIWSLFVNFAAFGLIAAACVADYLLRVWLLPPRPKDGALTMLRRALLG